MIHLISIPLSFLPTFPCSKSTIEAPEQCVKSAERLTKRHHQKGIFVVLMLLMFNFEQISHFALVFALLDFEPVNVGWVCNNKLLQKMLKP